MNKQTRRQSGGFAQRVGKLIEDHVCSEYGYYPNKRQQTRGYFDASLKDKIFEIKGVLKRTNRVTIRIDNHKKLIEHNGGYIFVNYDLINNDKNLSIINDIDILDIIRMDSLEVEDILNKQGVIYERNFKGHIKEYIRINFNYIMEYNDRR